jgi:hypothetical protein
MLYLPLPFWHKPALSTTMGCSLGKSTVSRPMTLIKALKASIRSACEGVNEKDKEALKTLLRKASVYKRSQEHIENLEKNTDYIAIVKDKEVKADYARLRNCAGFDPQELRAYVIRALCETPQVNP